MPRVLVTGGAGFLGSHLCEALLAQGDEVISLDDYSSSAPENIAQLLDHENFEAIGGDVTETLSAAHFGSIEQIYNLACPASPRLYQQHPVKTVRTCVLGAMNVLELARQTGARVLQASTSEVYGDPEVHPQPESYHGSVNPIGSRSCYDEGKRCAETLFFDYHRQFGVDIKVARIFNTYGPRLQPDDGRVVSNFAMRALAGEPLVIYGDGSQTRSFCYVDDMVRGLLLLMRSTAQVTGPINLGNPEEVTVRGLAEQIIGLADSASVLTQKPLPQDDPLRRQPDITLAKEVLDWHPECSLEHGLGLTLNYFSGLAFKP